MNYLMKTTNSSLYETYLKMIEAAEQSKLNKKASQQIRTISRKYRKELLIRKYLIRSFGEYVINPNYKTKNNIRLNGAMK